MAYGAIIKGVALGATGLAGYQIGKSAEKKKKRIEEKKLNKALKQHFNAMRARG